MLRILCALPGVRRTAVLGLQEVGLDRSKRQTRNTGLSPRVSERVGHADRVSPVREGFGDGQAGGDAGGSRRPGRKGLRSTRQADCGGRAAERAMRMREPREHDHRGWILVVPVECGSNGDRLGGAFLQVQALDQGCGG